MTGTIQPQRRADTATLLTLLVVPAFYDSIEIATERMVAKFKRRLGHGNAVVAFATTFGEAVLALLMLSGLYRAVIGRFHRPTSQATP